MEFFSLIYEILCMLPSETPVFATQVSWIGFHFASNCGGGYFKFVRNSWEQNAISWKENEWEWWNENNWAHNETK